MKISETELSDLLKKVYEGMGLAYGDYYDCTQAIAWLAMHGVMSLDELAHTIPNWELPPSRPATILDEDETTAVLQTDHNPSFLYNGLALELAAYKAQQHDHSTVKLKQVKYPFLIIPSLPLVAGHGLRCTVFWQDEGGEETAVTIHPHHSHPHVTPAPITPVTFAPDLTIHCAYQKQDASPSNLQSSLLAAYQHHNQNGLDVSSQVWAQLVVLSKNILVPESEQSRNKGAGEQAE